MMTGSIMRGIFVGSRRMAEKLADAIDANGIKPVIGATFGLEDAKKAYRLCQLAGLVRQGGDRSRLSAGRRDGNASS